jgi:hypothetical protein
MVSRLQKKNLIYKMTPIIAYKDMQLITIQLFPNLEQDPEGDPEDHVM